MTAEWDKVPRQKGKDKQLMNLFTFGHPRERQESHGLRAGGVKWQRIRRNLNAVVGLDTAERCNRARQGILEAAG
jgi:hypothetical protein